jgi:hypothetical protein
MVSLPRSNTDPTAKPSSVAPVSKDAKIETVTTEQDDEAHAADLQDTDIPTFARTNSYVRGILRLESALFKLLLTSVETVRCLHTWRFWRTGISVHPGI